jgi:tetratricopeptide (TPR) repeat protein
MGQWRLEGVVARGIFVFLSGRPIIPVQVAAPETGSDWIGCINRNKSVSDDQAIASCTPPLQPDHEPAASRAKAYFRRSHAYSNRGDFEHAVADFDAVIKLNPNAEAYAERGNAFCMKRSDERALADLTEAIRRDPNLAGAYKNRGLAYHRATPLAPSRNSTRRSNAIRDLP